MTWFDFHTHQLGKENCLFNVILNNEELPPANHIFSIGLHPWFELNEDLLIKLEEHLKNKHCLAIGETGLDRVRADNFDKQKEFLRKHIHLAKKYQKPIILHCVKAYQDTLEMIIDTNLSLPIIFHDYNGSIQTTERLLKEKNIYFSYGDKLFKENSKGFRSLPFIPLDRILIETDETINSIEEVGKQLAKIKSLSNEEISSHCFNNARFIFKNNDN
jgi:TatD DNase family protein